MEAPRSPQDLTRSPLKRINKDEFNNWQRAFQSCERRMAKLKIKMEQNYATKMEQILQIESNLFGR